MINYRRCINCVKFADYCTLDVHEIQEKNGTKKPVVKKPNHFVVFFTGCEEQCPTGAINFSSKKVIRETTRKLQKIV